MCQGHPREIDAFLNEAIELKNILFFLRGGTSIGDGNAMDIPASKQYRDCLEQTSLRCQVVW